MQIDPVPSRRLVLAVAVLAAVTGCAEIQQAQQLVGQIAAQDLARVQRAAATIAQQVSAVAGELGTGATATVQADANDLAKQAGAITAASTVAAAKPAVQSILQDFAGVQTALGGVTLPTLTIGGASVSLTAIAQAISALLPLIELVVGLLATPPAAGSMSPAAARAFIDSLPPAS